jgi:hypothetical protein
MWGDSDLGDNFSLLEGDRKEDRVIVFCDGRDVGACKSGDYIVPTYERHYDNKGGYAEYVAAATSNKNWIIAKTVQVVDNKENYWIVDKAYREGSDKRQPKVMGPFRLSDFRTKREELNISLEFEGK